MKKDQYARLRAGVSNNRGHDFEDAIRHGCALYARWGRAQVDKTPEPFRVLEKQGGGIFTGRFTAHAQPDFQGTLAGGRSVMFEAKYTITDRLKMDVLTQTQMETLEERNRMGALAAVCAGIGDRFFFVPWPVWAQMKRVYGKKTVTAADLEPFRVKFTGAVLFLDYLHEVRGPWITGAGCDFEKWRK